MFRNEVGSHTCIRTQGKKFVLVTWKTKSCFSHQYISNLTNSLVLIYKSKSLNEKPWNTITILSNQLSVYCALKIQMLVLSLDRSDTIRWQYFFLPSSPLSLGMSPGSHGILCFTATLVRVYNILACFDMWLFLSWKIKEHKSEYISLWV